MDNNWRLIKRTVIVLCYFPILILLNTSYLLATPPSFTQVDMVEFHSRALMSLGIEDLSYRNLVEILNKTDNATIKLHILYLFAEKGLKDSIPAIYPFLKDKNVLVRKVAADALSILGDFRGIPVLEKICEEKPDDLNCLDAAAVLARNGDFKAYGYLKNISKSKYGPYRSAALNYLRILAERIESTNPHQSETILDDVISAVSEEKDVIEKETMIVNLSYINLKKKEYFIERLRELRTTFSNEGVEKGILKKMDSTIKSLEIRTSE
jgi:hypothetical protein